MNRPFGIELSNQMVELHFRKAPTFDSAMIGRRTAQILNSEIEVPAQKTENCHLFIHQNRRAEFSDGSVPAQTVVLAAHAPIELDSYASDIQQSWACDDSEELLNGSNHTLLLMELMSATLPATVRVEIFHGVLQAVVEATHPTAMVCKHSQQVVPPESYLAATELAPIRRPGALNVRFFNISDSDGEMVMDTRGLHEIGLHDLQCHFRDLEPNEVAAVLLNTGLYLFENGPVIESGHTIAGIDEESRWVCQFENSLLAPEREILDVNPGPPFAAGGRT